MVCILLQTLSGSCLRYDVNINDPIYTLKADIEETEGIPIGEQTLHFVRGFVHKSQDLLPPEPLDEKQIFESYFIEEGSTVFLTPHDDLRFLVVVRIDTETFGLLVGPEYTVETIKSMIWDKAESSPSSDDEHLASISDEVILLDDPSRTLVSYGLTEEFAIRIYAADIPFVGLIRFPPPRKAKAHALVLRSWDGDMTQTSKVWFCNAEKWSILRIWFIKIGSVATLMNRLDATSSFLAILSSFSAYLTKASVRRVYTYIGTRFLHPVFTLPI